MNITKEDTGELTATVRIDIEESDYAEAVKKVLKDYQKNAKMPGFRPGKVPFGIIKKMYGKAVIADEVNKLLSESLNNYLKDNEINILGYPLANEEKTSRIDFENEKDFSFYFDIGLSPEPDFELSDKIKVDSYNVNADDTTLDKQIEHILSSNGSHIHPEESGEEDIIKGKIEEVDEQENLVENGISNDTSIAVDLIKLKTIKKKFTGLKKGDKVLFNPLKATKSEVETSTMLGIKKEDVKEYDKNFQFTVEEITRNIPAELNEELFNKIFPGLEIKTENEFREKLREELNKSFENETEKKFLNDAMEKMVEIADISLPKEFMVKWMLDQKDNKLTREEIEENFEEYAKSLKYQIIQNKIIKDENISVDEQEIRQQIKNYFNMQMPASRETDGHDERLDSIVDSIMKNEDEVNKINDQLYDQKIKDVLKEKIKRNNKNVTYEEFIEFIS
jgi:trigger factor